MLSNKRDPSPAIMESDRVAGRLPDFIAVGPTRTGTTWLHQFLTGSVGLPANVKETNFFDRDYDQGLKTYVKFFASCPKELPVGEIAPTYFYSRETRQRIAREIPDCKIIITLRDPIERQHSLYRLSVWNGRTKVTFAEATDRRWADILDECDYAKYIRQWQGDFSKHSVLVVLYDDFVAAPQEYVDRICEFVGIPSIDVRRGPVAPEQRIHAITQMPRGDSFGRILRWFFRLGQDRPDKFEAFLHWVRRNGAQNLIELLARTPVGKRFRKLAFTEMPSLDDQTAARLRNAIQPQIHELEILLDRDLSAWKRDAGAQNVYRKPESCTNSVARYEYRR